MEKIKVLNLYAGIGGNRKLWENVEVTAIEINPKIASIYKDLFPNDNVIVDDAHKYLLEHFNEYHFIWSSPPCPSHSRIRLLYVKKGQNKPIYPDMKLYEEILLLKYYFKGYWVVENVKSFYKPLIEPQLLQRHYFWSNFNIPNIKIKSDNIQNATTKEFSERYGYNLSMYKISNKKLLLRNCVVPKLGLHIFNFIPKDVINVEIKENNESGEKDEVFITREVKVPKKEEKKVDWRKVFET